MQSQPQPARIELVSTPWPLYNRPSIQLGALKAYLKAAKPRLAVQTHHFYLEVAAALGYRVYQSISERTWLAEAVYAALLYPEKKDVIEALFRKHARGHPELKAVAFETLTQTVDAVSQRLIARTHWERATLIGFSVCLCQLSASLFFIDRIKSGFPFLTVVVGGSMFAGEDLLRLLQAFPQIDYAVGGEGEEPLRLLVDHFTGAPQNRIFPPTKGIVQRRTTPEDGATEHHQVASLSALPVPDFDEYFQVLKTLDTDRRFFPVLPAEMSRGCWWRRTASGNSFSGCAFCNLNRQWRGYRFKGPQQVSREIGSLTDRYRSLSVAFMDNLIPLAAAPDIFEQLAGLNKDLRIFCEIRAASSGDLLRRMRRAGVAELQIGIEALSNRLLNRLNKGTTAIENLEVMKKCEELGLINTSNLIVQFPGSDQEDVTETLRNIAFAKPYRPMRCVRFWLGVGSPVWSYPAKFGVRGVGNHPSWNTLFPPEITSKLRFPIQTYRGDRTRQKKLWRPVRESVEQWAKEYAELHRDALHRPILSYRDGGEFMIIEQRRYRAAPLTHRLTGPSRKIYLYCERHKPLGDILNSFAAIAADRVQAFLDQMVAQKLMFTENRQYLSLAVSNSAAFK